MNPRDIAGERKKKKKKNPHVTAVRTAKAAAITGITAFNTFHLTCLRTVETEVKNVVHWSSVKLSLCNEQVTVHEGNPFFLPAVAFLICLFVCWLLNVPATGECISDLLRQFYVLPHWDRSCRSNVLPHPVPVYWHRANQSRCRPYIARRLAG